MKWLIKTYTDPATDEVVSRYVSFDGDNWMVVYTTEEVGVREETRRAISTPSQDQEPVNDPGVGRP
jgi:hypothetical protein